MKCVRYMKAKLPLKLDLKYRIETDGKDKYITNVSIQLVCKNGAVSSDIAPLLSEEIIGEILEDVEL